jgi:hypothetical protein
MVDDIGRFCSFLLQKIGSALLVDEAARNIITHLSES